MVLTYKYRLLPSEAQHAALATICESQRKLYCAALEERIDCYRKTGKGRSYIDQCKALTECRRDMPDMATLPANLQRWTLKRLDDAYAGFFRRLKCGGNPGFPRFRGKGWWSSFGFNEFSGIRWDGKRLRFAGMSGGLRVHLYRELPPDIRSCVFKRAGRQWWVCFQVEVATAKKRTVSTSVGLDLGLNVFAYQSDGVVIANPRFSRRTENEMRRRQRALARCKRGSRNRRKAKERLTRLHQKIVNQRTTWLHQQSARIARSYDLIAVEDLRVANMVKNPHLARSISDAGWSKFLSMASYKAERAGATFVTVDPRNTSQKCSGCGELVPKSLAVRIHCCPHCGLVVDRDWNAAINILAAVAGRGERNVAECRKRARRNVKLVERLN
jgi:putative transposase